MVVPSNRPERMREFVDAWAPLFRKHDVKLYVVWDLDEIPSIDLADYAPEVCVASRKSVPSFIPTGTDMIRSWGFYEAWRDGSPFILTLDDDVRPSLPDPFEAYEEVFRSGAVHSRFLDVGGLTTSGLQMRGFPYKDRAPAEVQVQYGAWNGVLDYDAATQLSRQPTKHQFTHYGALAVPVGTPVTTCIMNCAFRRGFAPVMWQLPLYFGTYNRFGDIWSGLFQKRVLDIVGDAMVLNTRAAVSHERASDPIVNLGREQSGIYYNEILADVVFDPHMPIPAFEDGSVIGESRMLTTFRAVTNWASAAFPDGYREHFLKARDEWLTLFA